MVAILPSPKGFYVAMNRDEIRDRFAALPPEIAEFENHRVLFPREPTGGTWISANDAGVCLALINWHRIERKPKNDTLSRGLVIKELGGKSTAEEIATAEQVACSKAAAVPINCDRASRETSDRMAL